MFVPKFGKVVVVNADDVETWRAQGGQLESEWAGNISKSTEKATAGEGEGVADDDTTPDKATEKATEKAADASTAGKSRK